MTYYEVAAISGADVFFLDADGGWCEDASRAFAFFDNIEDARAFRDSAEKKYAKKHESCRLQVESGKVKFQIVDIEDGSAEGTPFEEKRRLAAEGSISLANKIKSFAK